ncbi:SPW repeat protein [Actinoplanes sp. NBC_00393]|uniref:SPW repeat protein n=1 Tax=Actinoplanes sp. NBC_00393 TaxID=2975953 RepID=UPI002E1FFF19
MQLHVQFPFARRLLSEVVHTPSELTVLAGTWLIMAPLILDHGSADIAFIGWNDVVVGLAIVTLAFLRVVMPDDTAPLSLVNMGLGGWLIVAPFVRGYHTAPLATVNDIVVGIAVVVLARASWKAARRQRLSDEVSLHGGTGHGSRE